MTALPLLPQVALPHAASLKGYPAAGVRPGGAVGPSAPSFDDCSEGFVNELEKLHAQLRERRVARQNIEDKLKVARVKERKVNQKRRDIVIEEKCREHAARKLQRFMRGRLMRRLFISSAEHEQMDHINYLTAEPDRLKDQLQQLQHTVHDLVFTPKDCEVAVIKIQSWWRKCLAKRVSQLMIVTLRLRDLCRCVVTAATMIQSAYRRYCCHCRFHAQIHVAMELSRQKQRLEAQRGLKAIRGIQKAFRACIARKRAQRRRVELGFLEDLHALKMECASASNSMPLDPTKSPLLSDRGGPPRTHREIEKLQAAGLVPFYWSTKSEKIRHRIGGPAALKIQKLTMSVIDSNEPGSLIGGDIDLLGELWDMYPEGVSTGFTDGLDEDVWPVDAAGRRSKFRSNKRRVARSARRSNPSHLFAAPPSNTEWRANKRLQARDVAQRAIQGELDTEADLTDACEPHPLLANAPCILPRPPPPEGARRPRPQSYTRVPKNHDDDQDGCWDNADSFYEAPRCPEHRSPQTDRAPRPWLAASHSPCIETM